MYYYGNTLINCCCCCWYKLHIFTRENNMLSSQVKRSPPFPRLFAGVHIINRILYARLSPCVQLEISSWTQGDKIHIHKRACNILYPATQSGDNKRSSSLIENIIHWTEAEKTDKSGITHYFSILPDSKILPLFLGWRGLRVRGGSKVEGEGEGN